MVKMNLIKKKICMNFINKRNHIIDIFRKLTKKIGWKYFLSFRVEIKKFYLSKLRCSILIK
jgi:hypothetical protein